MAHGIPVLAHKSVGHLETIDPKVSGMYFDDLTVECMVKAIRDFDNRVKSGGFDKEAIKQQAQKFSKKRFQKEFHEFVMDKWNNRQNNNKL